MVVLARVCPAIGAGDAFQVMGGGALAMAGRSMGTVVLIVDPFCIFGGVRVDTFDKDAAASGNGNSAIMLVAKRCGRL